MLRERLSERFRTSTPLRSRYYRESSYDTVDEKETPIISEWRLGLIGLIISIFVIVTKLIHSYYDNIHNAIYEMKFVQYEVLTQEGEIMFKYAWEESVKYSRFWLPALCGFLITYFTWLMVYLDSSQPGVQPPSPFSPTKYKTQSGHLFHLNYVFAVVMGILAAGYMYWRGVSI